MKTLYIKVEKTQENTLYKVEKTHENTVYKAEKTHENTVYKVLLFLLSLDDTVYQRFLCL